MKREQIRAKEEITRIKSVPLVIGQFSEMVDENYGIVVSTAGSSYYGIKQTKPKTNNIAVLIQDIWYNQYN